MKKFFFSILAVGTLVACTKSEVKFDDASEIAFAPVASTATKAAITDLQFPSAKDFNVWAFYGKESPSATPTYQNYTTKYIDDATFTRRANSFNWGGKALSYYWPNNGSLVFAGYSAPESSIGGLKVGENPTYDLSNDKLCIYSYTQPAISKEYTELLWFGRNGSFNNRNTNNPVNVEFQHALSWITLKFQGRGMTAEANNEWKIKKIEINDILRKGNVECVGDKATWKDRTNGAGLVVYDDVNGTQLTGSAQIIETVTNGTLVIPQQPTKVTITYSCKTPAGETITEVVNASLEYDGTKEWENGKHYIYTITFSATEILIAPTVAAWDEYENIVKPAN